MPCRRLSKKARRVAEERCPRVSSNSSSSSSVSESEKHGSLYRRSCLDAKSSCAWQLATGGLLHLAFDFRNRVLESHTEKLAEHVLVYPTFGRSRDGLILEPDSVPSALSEAHWRAKTWMMFEDRPQEELNEFVLGVC